MDPNRPPPHIPLQDADGALSRAYLEWRGHCCENGCRNCPYGFEGVQERARIREAFRPEYELGPVIGRGATATVFRAVQTSLDRAVALKVLHEESGAIPSVRERLLREAQLASRIASSHVVEVFDHGDREGRLYIAYRMVEGSNLRAVLDERQQLDPDEAIRILAAILEGLGAIHEQGFVHRDLKPENILIETGTRTPLITDLGLARDPEGEDLTQKSVIIGTPAYMAPEQIRGDFHAFLVEAERADAARGHGGKLEPLAAMHCDHFDRVFGATELAFARRISQPCKWNTRVPKCSRDRLTHPIVAIQDAHVRPPHGALFVELSKCRCYVFRLGPERVEAPECRHCAVAACRVRLNDW